jgi:hypothetical protein
MISTLLSLVLTLLVAVQSPNVPESIRVEALQVASQVLLLATNATTTPDIATSTAAIETLASTTPPAIPQGSLPVFVTPSGGIVDSNGNPVITPAPAPAPIVVAPPIVPVCTLTANVLLHGNKLNPNYQVYFGWTMNPEATGFLSGYGTLPHYASGLPQYQTTGGNTDFVTVIQSATSTTYTLTETMTDPAYQTTTTCRVTADAPEA